MRNKLATILTVAALTLTLGACSATADTTSVTTATTVTDVTGQAGDTASITLTKAGYLVKFSADNGKTVLLPSNWTVISQDPAAGTALKVGGTVTLTVTKPEASPTTSATPAPSAPTETTTSAGLTASSAMVACDNAANTQFPYGYKPHWILDNIAQRVESDHWFMKVGITVTNQFNAKRDAVMECTVSGTDDAPVVQSLTAY